MASSSSIYMTAISTSDTGAIRGSHRGGKRRSLVHAAVAISVFVSEEYICGRSDAVLVGEFIIILQGRPLLELPLFRRRLRLHCHQPPTGLSPPPLSIPWRPIPSPHTSKPSRPSPILSTLRTAHRLSSPLPTYHPTVVPTRTRRTHHPLGRLVPISVQMDSIQIRDLGGRILICTDITPCPYNDGGGQFAVSLRCGLLPPRLRLCRR